MEISTHALREEGDFVLVDLPFALLISTHALREEGDGFHSVLSNIHERFLPTPSARRATEDSCKILHS